MARILTSSYYGLTFNAPRKPQRHILDRVRFLPMHRITRSLEALAVPWVSPFRRDYDLIHTFNHVPITDQLWMSSFESAMPRSYGWGNRQVRRALRKRLALPNCVTLIAISEYARRRFVADHADWPRITSVLEKMQVIHPNLPLLRTEPKALGSDGIHLLFIGREWARKGGVVALRVAREAQKRALPIRLTMVTSLIDAGYGQHPDPRRYAPELALISSLPNVRHYHSLPNSEVLKLVADADLTLLPTTHDTYGFSVLEGMAVGTPAIVTNAAALAEVVRDGVNGFALDVPLNDLGEYAHINETDWDIWDAFYDELTRQTIDRLESLLAQPSLYTHLSSGSIERIRDFHESQKVGAKIETIYDSVLSSNG